MMSSRSAIGMQQTDKFSSKIAPLIGSGERTGERYEPPVFMINPETTRTNSDLKNLGIRSNSTMTPSQSLYPSKQTSTSGLEKNAFDRTYAFTGAPNSKSKKMLLTITKEDNNKI